MTCVKRKVNVVVVDALSCLNILDTGDIAETMCNGQEETSERHTLSDLDENAFPLTCEIIDKCQKQDNKIIIGLQKGCTPPRLLVEVTQSKCWCATMKKLQFYNVHRNE